MLTYVRGPMATRAACHAKNGPASRLHREAWSKSDSRPASPPELSGFTLVELLITIVIAGIIASLAVPSFREFIAGQRIRTASFDIMATLVLTRSEAIKRNANVTAAPAGGVWTDGWSVTAPDGTVLNQQSALPGLSITCKTGSTTVTCPSGGLVYAGNGRLTAAAPSFEISSTSSTSVRCISIDLGGRPNSKTEACS